MDFDHPRITFDPGICGGKPIIRGMRFRVCDVLSYLAAGETAESLVQEFPFLELEDITAALAFAADLTEDTKIGNMPKAREYIWKGQKILKSPD
jgi:uncharacterized protein (DUF433 family)